VESSVQRYIEEFRDAVEQPVYLPGDRICRACELRTRLTWVVCGPSFAEWCPKREKHPSTLTLLWRASITRCLGREG
jgi:hypothetical protein